MIAITDATQTREEEHVSDWSRLPDGYSEADVNAFVSLWDDDTKSNIGDEGDLRDLEADLSRCETGIEVMRNCFLGFDKEPHKKNFFFRNADTLADALLHTVDEATTNILLFLEKWQVEASEDGDVESTMLLTKSTNSIKYGLWAGNRLPRVRNVDFGPLNFTLSPKDGAHLPKQLALMNSIGVRIMHFDCSLFGPRENHQDGQEYYSLGGVFFIELVSYPAPPKHAKEWTIRPETSMAHSLHRVPYPPKDGAPAPPPVRISFQVPDTLMVRHTAPIVGLWDPDEKAWSPDQCSDFVYDASTGRASYLTQQLGPMSIIQEKGHDVPYERWSLIPISSEECLYEIECRQHLEADEDAPATVITILVRDLHCIVVHPNEPALSRVREEWHAPGTLIRLLADSGYQFCLSDADAAFLPDLSPKVVALEKKGYQDIAWLSGAFGFASSAHNKYGENRSMALFRVTSQHLLETAANQEPFAADIDELPIENPPKPPVDPLVDFPTWMTIRYEPHRCAICRAHETSETELDLGEKEGKLSHLNLYYLMEAEFGPDLLQNIYENANPLLCKSVYELLSLTRPFSWG
eukprot:NODE_515_length_2010_cov_39.642529_g410_i0.p1 GENE.NODE_515_length_2010_cov_39.642529_g410_i0~~NODE_515_length_2010_cov_39.642529_g410_i0.p1  ORF type:complete len:653 (-),score=190.31 NODE_515_length_2010_cov_39.642529_g410_i0:50-1786(-)